MPGPAGNTESVDHLKLAVSEPVESEPSRARKPAETSEPRKRFPKPRPEFLLFIAERYGRNGAEAFEGAYHTNKKQGVEDALDFTISSLFGGEFLEECRREGYLRKLTRKKGKPEKYNRAAAGSGRAPAIAMLERRVKADVFAGKEQSIFDAIDWVLEHAYLKIKPEEAPSRRAYSLYRWVSSDTKALDTFMSQIVPKMLPSKQQIERAAAGTTTQADISNREILERFLSLSTAAGKVGQV